MGGDAGVLMAVEDTVCGGGEAVVLMEVPDDGREAERQFFSWQSQTLVGLKARCSNGSLRRWLWGGGSVSHGSRRSWLWLGEAGVLMVVGGRVCGSQGSPRGLWLGERWCSHGSPRC